MFLYVLTPVFNTTGSPRLLANSQSTLSAKSSQVNLLLLTAPSLFQYCSTIKRSIMFGACSWYSAISESDQNAVVFQKTFRTTVAPVFSAFGVRLTPVNSMPLLIACGVM